MAIVSVVSLRTTIPAHADTTVYLPYVSHEEPPPQLFTVEWVRLWHISESGGRSSPFTCGTKHTLQVDVFDLYGEGSTQPGTVNGRLNGVTVEVSHRAPDTSRTLESQLTGAGGNDDGIAIFTLDAGAAVQISADVNGEVAGSPPVTVSTVIAEIPQHRLIAAGYCSDDTSCQALIDADACRGNFSWGVVFKRTY